ncbi:adaptor related protein complex 3 subunit sigma 2 [Homo sapiens]|uniref:Adaptor related protein complex 3 subunit sigma 2 n=1 Tax=Homo sapiens TaxID=9606 RepID=A0A087WY05_HUMAN|nr:adaptor related protein complex 3 subunit sigma 2 [Homo sapiens]KAI4059415.1 adaptor related protein complex 3 subunit sigma 2 [Homo sapiens]
MIQAILVFNNHGKPRLVRFYQRFVSAARLHHAPSGRPLCLPSSLASRRPGAPLFGHLGLLHRA